ncbi:hypothetical protein [Sphingopyxis sp. H050]|jgi:hypothetical protein|nr:hypothetical protein [Sphingopyxis sp. H050]
MLMHVPTGNPRGAAIALAGTIIDAIVAASIIAFFIQGPPNQPSFERGLR